MKHRGTANPEYITAMRDLRRSGATTPQETRSDRKGSRSARKARAIREDRS